MLKVGDFSQLAHVTVKALRHYDEIGLLKPVWIDRFSGYRYYTPGQLPRLNRILALKDLGFSLAQIRDLLDDDLPSSKLCEIFRQKQAELEQRVVKDQNRLQWVAERLEEIERQGYLPLNEMALKPILITHPFRKEKDMEPKIVELPAFDVVGVRYYGKNENQEISGIWEVFNKRAGEIKHVKPRSAAYGICRMVPDAPAGEFEYVASFSVNQTDEIPAGMVTRHVPAHKYAVFTHNGSLDKLRETYNYIYQVWAQQSGYELTGDIDFEYYDQDFKDFAPDSKFYIYVPVK
jgi:predicted transcriptional regulator YdeE